MSTATSNAGVVVLEIKTDEYGNFKCIFSNANTLWVGCDKLRAKQYLEWN